MPNQSLRMFKFALAAALSSALCAAQAETYYWIGESDAQWGQTSSWSLSNPETETSPAAASAVPATGDIAVFSASSDGKTVVLAADAAATTIQFGNVSVAFSGSKALAVHETVNLPDCTGKMILKGEVHLRPINTIGHSDFKVDLEVPAGETAYIDEQGDNSDPYVYGAIAGSGTLHLKNNAQSNYRGPKIYGDLSAFAGTIVIDKNNGKKAQRNETVIYDGDNDGVAGSSLANWKDCYSSSASGRNLLCEGVKYYFGAYTGDICQMTITAGLIEIGALNASDDSLGGEIRNTPLRKVGTGTLTVSAKQVGPTEINGGTIEIAADTQNGSITFTGEGEYRQNAAVTTDYSAKFTGSTAFPVVFNDGGVDRTWATAIDASNTAGFTKRGSGTLTLSVVPKHQGTTKVEGGALVMPFGAALTKVVVSSDAALNIDLTGAVDDDLLLTVAEASLDQVSLINKSDLVSVLTNVADGVATLTATRPVSVFTWSGSVDDNWATAGNWLLNGVATEEIPTSMDKVQFTSSAAVSVAEDSEVGSVVLAADVILSLPAGVTMASLALGENAKLSIRASAAEVGDSVTAVTITDATGITADDIVLPPAFAGTFENGVFTATREAGSYVWTGNNGTDWADAGNWSIDGNVSTVTPGSSNTSASPESLDTVVFPARTGNDESWTVSLADKATVSSVVFNAAVSLTGADIYTQEATSRLETATAPVVTLGDDAGFHAYDVASAKLTISVPLCITASAEHPAEIAGWWSRNVPASGAAIIRINGNLTGDGALTVKGVRATMQFSGDNSAFAGTITVPSDYSAINALRVSPYFVESTSTSSNAVYVINNYGCLLRPTKGSQTYAFGALSGYVSLNRDAQGTYLKNTLEIGHREDVDSDLDGDFFANPYVNLAGDRGNTIRKIGNSTLTTSAFHVRAYELNGGLTVLDHDRAVHTRWNPGDSTVSEVTDETAEAEKIYDIPISFGGGVLALGDSVTADPSANIQNSTAAIAFSNDTDRTWATALAASNVGGFTKKGSGALTLSAVPEYAGVTKVEAGTLVVPEGTKLALDLASAGALTGGTITNAAFVAATTSTTVTSDLTNVAVKEWDAAIDVGNLTIDLTEKTDWARGATYYVVTEGGVVCGNSVLNRKKVTLLLPSEQQKDWALRVVDLNGKKTLAVKERGGLVMVIR